MICRRWIAAVMAAALISYLPLPSRADDSDALSLLAKHRAYVGWELGDGSINTLRLTGAITNEKGKDSILVASSSTGLIYRATYTYPERANVTQSSGYTGQLFWLSNNNGFTTPIFGDLAKYRAAQRALFAEATTKLPATMRPNASVAGREARVVRVQMPSGDAIDLYIDGDTGAYVQAVIDPGGSYETTVHVHRYDDALPGKKIIASYSIDDSKAVYNWTKIEANVPLSDGALHPPAATATWDFANPAPFPISITHDRLIVDATVNGTPGHFILDTGSDGIALNDGFANRAKVDMLHAGELASGIGGTVKTAMRKIDKLEIGGNTLSNVIVDSQNFERDDTSGLDGKGYDGLIGFDLFAAALVKIDFAASKMTILDPSTANASSERGVPVVVDLSEGIPAIPMILNKNIHVNALLDSGSPEAVFLSPDLVKTQHLNMITTSDLAAGVGGSEAVDCGNLDSLAIGPIVYGGQKACESDSFGGDDVLVGFDFLKHFNIFFDYPHAQLVLEPLEH